MSDDCALNDTFHIEVLKCLRYASCQKRLAEWRDFRVLHHDAGLALLHFCCSAAVLGQTTKSGPPSAIISADLPRCDIWLSWRLLE
jgi:hypothetical protein